jgi:ribose transport system substrate-binding protein
MKKTLIVVVALLVCASILVVGCSSTPAAETSAAATEAASTEADSTEAASTEADSTEAAVTEQKHAGTTVGYIQSGPDLYYEQTYRVFEALAEEQGWEISKTASDYDPKKETNNVQDMIAKGVDLIVLNDVTSSNGAACAKIADEAGVPMFFVTTLPDDSPGVTASCSGAWYQCGELWAEWMMDKLDNKEDAQFVLIEGAYGQGTTELMRLGFIDKLASILGKTSQEVFDENIAYNQTAQWQTDQAVTVMQDAMAKTGGEFDGVIAANEAMLLGVQKALEASPKEYLIATENGYEETIEAIKTDPNLMTVSCPATAEGEIVFQQVMAYLDGEDFPKFVKCPFVLVDSETVDTAAVLPYKDADNYIKWMKEGLTGIDIFTMEDSGSTDPDWSGTIDQNGAKSD